MLDSHSNGVVATVTSLRRRQKSLRHLPLRSDGGRRLYGASADCARAGSGVQHCEFWSFGSSFIARDNLVCRWAPVSRISGWTGSVVVPLLPRQKVEEGPGYRRHSAVPY